MLFDKLLSTMLKEITRHKYMYVFVTTFTSHNTNYLFHPKIFYILHFITKFILRCTRFILKTYIYTAKLFMFTYLGFNSKCNFTSQRSISYNI